MWSRPDQTFFRASIPFLTCEFVNTIFCKNNYCGKESKLLRKRFSFYYSEYLLPSLYSLYIVQHWKMSVKPMAGFDMENRDPNNLNEHLQVYWKYYNCFWIEDLRFIFLTFFIITQLTISVQFRWCGMI